jgi:hypothetical protein
MTDKITRLQVKVLLAKAIIKNWHKASPVEKKAVEEWWKKTYGEFSPNEEDLTKG